MQCDNSDDLTTRRVKSKWKALFLEFEAIFERVGRSKPGFWELWLDLERAMVEKMKARPLALGDIENTFSQFRAKMLKAL